MQKIIRRLCCVVLCCLICACTTMRPVENWRAPLKDSSSGSPATTATAGLQVADEIVITTQAGVSMRLVVSALEKDALIGVMVDRTSTQRVPYSDINHIARKEIHTQKTTLVVMAVALGLLFSYFGGLFAM